MEPLIREAQDAGMPQGAFVHTTLDTMYASLRAMLEHRAMIAHTVAAIDAGLLSSPKHDISS